MIQKLKCFFGFHELWQDPEYQPSRVRTCKHCWYYDFAGKIKNSKPLEKLGVKV